MFSPDATMEAITQAVARGRNGDAESARRELLQIWQGIGVAGDPLHRCTLGHYLADLYDDPAQALIWDVRALDAATELTDDRAQQHHASLQVAAFYPSLHLNIADDLRRLGSFRAAAEYIEKAEESVSELADDPYGQTVRSAIAEVGDAIEKHDNTPRASAPGSTG